jgi:hypothetical protein
VIRRTDRQIAIPEDDPHSHPVSHLSPGQPPDLQTISANQICNANLQGGRDITVNNKNNQHEHQS